MTAPTEGDLMTTEDVTTTGPVLDQEVLEAVASDVHAAWMAAKRAQGITSRPSEWGEEQMVPYAHLSERAKDLDRSTVRSVLGTPAVAALVSAARDEGRDSMRQDIVTMLLATADQRETDPEAPLNAVEADRRKHGTELLRVLAALIERPS